MNIAEVMHEEAERRKAQKAAKDAKVANLALQGLSHREIAERMGISQSAVIDAIRRARS